MAYFRLSLFLFLVNSNVSKLLEISDKSFDFKVRELGTPAMALFEPEVATKKATFGMS